MHTIGWANVGLVGINNSSVLIVPLCFFMANLYSHLCILGWEMTTFLPLKETTHITFNFHTVCHSCCATETSHYTSSLWLTHMYFLWKRPHTSYCSQIVMRCHFAEWHGILLSRALLRHMQNKMSTLTSEQYFVQLIFDSALPPFFSLFHTHAQFTTDV